MLKSLCLWLGLCSVPAVSGPAYVIDGDTIALSGVHIRLQGIDAPELSEPGGYAAKSALKAFVTPSTLVHCELNGEHSYGRLIGTCTANDQDLGELMVKNGFALDCEYYSHGKYKQWEPVNIHLKLSSKPYCNRR